MNFESADALEVQWASRHIKATTCEEGRQEKSNGEVKMFWNVRGPAGTGR